MEDKLDKIISLLQELVDSSKTYNGYARWTHEQEELVDIMHNQGLDISIIIATIKMKFGIDRSEGAIKSRISKTQAPPIKKFKKTVDDEPKVWDIHGEPPF